MGKHKRDKSADLMRKIRKLEKEVERSRRRRRFTSDSSEQSFVDNENDNSIIAEDLSHDEYELDYDQSYDDCPQLKSVINKEADTPTEEYIANKDLLNITSPLQQASCPEESVPIEILSILGEAKKVDEQFGTKVPQEISERWGKILLEGLSKEAKEELMKKMLIPENFQLAKAPKLNAEVASVLTEPAKNRDKRQELAQNQLGSAIAGIVYLTTEIINNNNLEKMTLLQKLSEISQILLDLHYHETQNRRRLIMPLLDKSFVNITQGIKRNIHLFGDNLDENIKTKKSIEKSSQLIKKPAQYTNSRRATSHNQQGNLRTAPRQQITGGRPYAPPATPARYYREATTQPQPPAARRQPAAQATRPRGRATQPSRSYDRKTRR